MSKIKKLPPISKPLYWVGGSRKGMQALPEDAQSVFAKGAACGFVPGSKWPRQWQRS